VAWIGPDPVLLNVEIFQYWPEDRGWWEELTNDTTSRAGRYVNAMTMWNRDMKDLVQRQGMQPSLAREKLQRIYFGMNMQLAKAFGEINLIQLSVPMGALKPGGSQFEIIKEASKVMAEHVAEEAEEVAAEFEQKLGIAVRRELPVEISSPSLGTLYKIYRAVDEFFEVSLGPGTYFTNDAAVAQQYADIQGGSDGSGRTLYRAYDRKEFGNTLDLMFGPHAGKWQQLVDAWKVSATEPLYGPSYYSLVSTLLDRIGKDEEQFDSIIGENYAGKAAAPGQLCVFVNVRNPDVFDSLVATADVREVS
jgi:hypothetical protein